MGSLGSLRKDGFGQADKFVYACFLPVISRQQIHFRGKLWGYFHYHIVYNSLTGLNSSIYLLVKVMETGDFGAA